MLKKNEFLLLEDFSDYNPFPKFQPTDDRLHVNERFSIIIDHRSNTSCLTNNLFRFQLISVKDSVFDLSGYDYLFFLKNAGPLKFWLGPNFEILGAQLATEQNHLSLYPCLHFVSFFITKICIFDFNASY